VGADHQRRFLPSVFDEDCNALDLRGESCHRLACPRCHLEIPRVLLEMPPFFISVFGTPSSGKSCFMASMVHQLRNTMPRDFEMTFLDADLEMNAEINAYEQLQFMSEKPGQVSAVRKTEVFGDLYRQVQLGDRLITYLPPSVFAMRPHARHPNIANARRISNAVCVYDNAGEHFETGRDASRSPVTRHLAKSNLLAFLFDPTQDRGFRKACSQKSLDPQFADPNRLASQETILVEVANRIRKHAGLSVQQKLKIPVMVLLAKYDAWAECCGFPARLEQPWSRLDPARPSKMDTKFIEEISDKLRRLLLKLSPQIVAISEDLSDEVYFLPVSAYGHCAQIDEETGMLGICPDDIKPMWTDTPLLFAMAKWRKGIIPLDKNGLSPASQQAKGGNTKKTEPSEPTKKSTLSPMLGPTKLPMPAPIIETSRLRSPKLKPLNPKDDSSEGDDMMPPVSPDK